MSNYNEKPSSDRNFDQASKQQNRTGSKMDEKSRTGSAGQTQRPQSPTNR